MSSRAISLFASCKDLASLSAASLSSSSAVCRLFGGLPCSNAICASSLSLLTARESFTCMLEMVILSKAFSRACGRFTAFWRNSSRRSIPSAITLTIAIAPTTGNAMRSALDSAGMRPTKFSAARTMLFISPSIRRIEADAACVFDTVEWPKVRTLPEACWMERSTRRITAEKPASSPITRITKSSAI